LQTADPALGGTVRILTAAVMRLADENLALSERVSRLAGLLEGATPGQTIHIAGGFNAATPETGETLEEAAVPPDDIADAEFVRLLHETALPLATPEKTGDAADDLISFGELEW
jgi:hypothetical protein